MPEQLRINRHKIGGTHYRITIVWGLLTVTTELVKDYKQFIASKQWQTVPRIWE